MADDELWGKFHELEALVHDVSHAFWGDSVRRDNGVRSRVRRHARLLRHVITRIDKLEGSIRHYLDKERRETCFGVAELDKHLEEHRSFNVEEVAVRVAKIQADTERSKFKWQNWVTLAGFVLVLLGQVWASTSTAEIIKKTLQGKMVETSSRYPAPAKAATDD